MASHAPHEDGEGQTSSIRSDADTGTKKYLEMNCFGKPFSLSLPSNLTQSQIGIGLVLIFLCSVVYLQNIPESFLVVLGVIIIAGCLEAYAYVRRRLCTKSKEKGDPESIQEDKTKVSATKEPLSTNDLEVPLAHPTPDKVNKRPEDIEPEDLDDLGDHHREKLEMEMMERMGDTVYRDRMRAARTAVAEGEKKDVRKYFEFIASRMATEGSRYLAYILGIREDYIENVFRGRNSMSRCLDLLYQWLEKNPREATIEVLMKALSSARQQHVVQDLKSEYPELRDVD